MVLTSDLLWLRLEWIELFFHYGHKETLRIKISFPFVKLGVLRGFVLVAAPPQLALDLALRVALGYALAFIVQFLAAGQGDLDLGAPIS